VGVLRDQGRAGARVDVGARRRYFKTSYEADLALVDTRLRRLALTALVLVLLALPRFASGFVLDLVSQAAFAAIGALALNVLTGLAGQSR